MTLLLLLWLALRGEQESATAKLERKKAADKLDEVNRNLLAVQIKLTSDEEEKKRIQFEHEIEQIDREGALIELEMEDEWHGSDRARELTILKNELMLRKSELQNEQARKNNEQIRIQFERQHAQYLQKYNQSKSLQSKKYKPVHQAYLQYVQNQRLLHKRSQEAAQTPAGYEKLKQEHKERSKTASDSYTK